MAFKRNKELKNPSNRKMSVDILKGYEDHFKMNKKALRILAKRGF